MNIAKSLMAFATLALAGCISVETTKAQLESGNSAQLAEAEKIIYNIGVGNTQCDGLIVTGDRLDYVNLTKKQELLQKIYKGVLGDNDSVAIAVAGRLNFSTSGSLVDFLRKNNVRRLAPSGRHGTDRTEEVEVLLKSIFSTASMDDLVSAARVISDDFDKGGFLVKPLKDKLLNESTDEGLLFEMLENETLHLRLNTDDRQLVLGKLKDPKHLLSCYCDAYVGEDCEKILAKIDERTILEFMNGDKRFVSMCNGLDRRHVNRLIGKVKDEDKLVEAAIIQSDFESVKAILRNLKNEKSFARIVCESKLDRNRSLAMCDLKSYSIMADTLIKIKDADAKLQLDLVKRIPEEGADEKLYDGVKNAAVKKAVLNKLSRDAKASIRNRDKAVCEKLIADAKEKGKDTFELGGFYLGMKIDDANKLVGYHFPEYQTDEVVDGDKRVLYVSYQTAPFCLANKDGVVYRLAFGKKTLKKWYNYDVQTPREWASAYGRENRIDMRYKQIESKTMVFETDLSRSYNVAFLQGSYQYRNNAKEYRLTVFDEEKVFTGEDGLGDAVLKEMAAKDFRYVRGDQWMLRAAFDRD